EIGLAEFISNELNKISSLDFCKTEFHTNTEEIPLEDSKKLVLVRMIQECLNNAIKHAVPSLISIKIEYAPVNLSISMVDNGVGFDVNKESAGQGIRNLQTRIKTIGGNADVRSASGQGTQIRLSLPN